MLDFLINNTWKKLPQKWRVRLVRTTQSKFTVSVIAIVTNDEGKILIADHYIRPGASWGLPGGFVDKNESPEEAIKREILEETGLELINIKLHHIRTVNKHLEITFSGKGIGEAEIKTRELRDLGWFSLSEFPVGMHPIQAKIIKELLNDY